MRYIIYQLLIFLLFTASIIAQDEQAAKSKYDVFSFDKQVTLPGTPEVIFDAVTGDISGWWDLFFITFIKIIEEKVSQTL